MDRRKREVTFQLHNVVVNLAGPLKDEASFEGILEILKEDHGYCVEWTPTKLRNKECKSGTPESDWEDVATSVGYKPNHDENAVEIKSVRLPNSVKFEIPDLASYRRADLSSEHRTSVTFLLKDGTNIPSFQLESSDFNRLLGALGHHVSFKRSPNQSDFYLVVDSASARADALDKSFSELDLFADSKSHIISNIIKDPYNTAMGGFSKVTNILYDYLIFSPLESRNIDNDLSAMISGQLHVDIDNQEEPGFELITKYVLPSRIPVTREDPVTLSEFAFFMDQEGRIKDFEGLKRRVFRGGIEHSVRAEVWKFLLDFYDPNTTHKERDIIKQRRSDDYFRMKLQWKTITADQESRFSALRDRKSLIEKDVSRTDRTHPDFEGENNSNIQKLQDILMTYCMYNFDLGYVQGMSDLLSPILVVMQEEEEAFWCFAGWLNQIGSNFEMEQQGMKKQLQDLYRLLHFVDSELSNYLEKQQSSNMYFAFRWLLILFKRDFKFDEIMRLWEVLWTGLPCKNFHLLICLAILDSEKLIIIENKYGLTEILKHVNEMSYKIHLESTLCKAESIFHQVRDCKYRSDIVESILGLDPLPFVEPPPPKSSPSRHSNNTAASNRLSDRSDAHDSMDEFVNLEPNVLFDLPY